MAIILLVLESAAVGSFFAPNALFFLIFTAGVAGVLFLATRSPVGFLARRDGITPGDAFGRIVVALSPLVLLFLKQISAVAVLMDVSGFLPPLALGGSAFLLFREFSRGRSAGRPEGEPPSGRAWPILAASAFLVYAFLGSGLVLPRHPFTGDEPHYVLIAHSLVHDADINLFNNYTHKDYLRFYPGEMESHAKPGRRGEGTLYSRHLPALPVLLVPFYILAEKTRSVETFIFIMRLPIFILAALLGAAFYLFALDLTGNRRAAAIVWLLFSFTAPMLFFSGLIYPEVPAALILLLVFWFLILRRDRRPAVLYLSGLGLATLPWFAAKYGILSIILFVMAALPLVKDFRSSFRDLLRLAVIPVVSGALYFFFLWSTYGHLNPAAVYAGADMPRSLAALRPAAAVNFREFVSAALGVLFEQKSGILIYGPVYFLAAAGVFLLWKKRKALAAELLIVFGAFWLQSAKTFYLGGYVPPGRPFVPLTWVLAGLAAVAWAAPAGRVGALIKGGLAGASLLVAGLSLFVPELLYHLNVNPRLGEVARRSRFLSWTGNLLGDPSRAAPAFDPRGLIRPWPLLAWVFALVLVTVTIVWAADRAKGIESSFSRPGRTAHVLVAALVIYGGAFIHVRLDPGAAYQTDIYDLYTQDENAFGPEAGGFWTKGTRTARFVLRSPVRLSSLTLEISSASAGETELRFDRLRRVVRHDPRTTPKLDVVFDAPRGFAWRGTYLYTFDVRERRAFMPFIIDHHIHDNRTLGVFVTVPAPVRHPSGDSDSLEAPGREGGN